MKLLLVTCLVASAFAAPAERTKRDILPGDARYDPKIHNQHKHHETDVEISKAIGGFTGAIPTPEAFSQYSGFQTDAQFGGVESLSKDAYKNLFSPSDSSVFKFGDTKLSEQLKSDVESNSVLSKDESVNTLIPSTVSTSSDPPINILELNKPLFDDKVSTKTTDDTKIEGKSADDGIFSDAEKTTTKSTTIAGKSSTKTIPSDDSIVTSAFPGTFDSGFGSTDFSSSFPLSSEFDTFHQTGYNPSIDSFGEYNPSFGGFKTNYNFYNNYGSSPLGFDTVSVDYSSRIIPQPFQFQNTYSTPEILSSSLYPSFTDFSPSTTYFSPSIGDVSPEFYGTEFFKDQQVGLKKTKIPGSTPETTSVKSKQEIPTRSKFDPETSNFSPSIGQVDKKLPGSSVITKSDQLNGQLTSAAF